MLKKFAEGLNNVTVQTNVCTCGYLTADVGETYRSCKRENIGLITGSGKERSTQSMSELLEKILDNRNMNEAYEKVCANKGAGGVDGMEIKELDGYIRENWDSIREKQEKTRDTNRHGQGNPAGDSTGNQPDVRAVVLGEQLRIPRGYRG